MDDLFDTKELPLSNRQKIKRIQEKILQGEEISIFEKVVLGRDNPDIYLGDYQCKSNFAYRAISEKMFDRYIEVGFIIGNDENDDYMEFEQNGEVYNNNKGVDWYLGGYEKKYGNIIIECPARKDFFVLAYDNGNGMASNPYIRFIKSSGYKNPVPINMISNVFDVRLLSETAKEDLGEEKYNKLVRKQELRKIYLEKARLDYNEGVRRAK